MHGTLKFRLALSSAALAITIASSSAQTTFNWTGGPSGTGTFLFGTTGLENWDPILAATDYAAGTANLFVIASRTGGGPGALIGGGNSLSLEASGRMGTLSFANPSGHLPATLSIIANASTTTSRVIWFDQPNTTIISLGDDVTSTIKIGNSTGATSTNGHFGLRLPDSGTSTIHVANAAATLDLTGLFDNVTSRGAIHGGEVTQSSAHAMLRKTGAGTLDLRTADGQGNRVLGTVIEGGTVIVSSTLQLGWTPLEAKTDAIVLNGGKLQFTNSGFITSAANRGVQVGAGVGTIELTDSAVRIDGLISNVTGEAGVLRKTGSANLGLAGAASHTGGTLLENGQLTLIANQTLGGSGGAGLTTSANTIFRGSGIVNGNSSFATNSTLRVDEMLSTVSTTNLIGLLTFSNNLTLGDLSLVMDLDTPAASDRIHVAGALDIGEGVLNFSNFTLTPLANFAPGVFTLFSSANPIVGTLGSSLNGTVGGFDAQLGLSSGGNSLLLTVIPEPATYALVFGAAALLGAALRRRSRAS
jgi:fibronectin-binding autotransporter adhesin